MRRLFIPVFLLGSLLPSPEAVQGVGFIIIFPVTFIASTFVPVDTLPGVLRTIAEWNPVTAMAEALRRLFGNPAADFGANARWPIQHSILYSVIWIVGIIAVCAPLAVRAYQRTISN